VVLVDLVGRVQVASQYAPLLLGYDRPDEVVGHVLFEGCQVAYQDGSVLQADDLPWIVTARTGQPGHNQLVRVSPAAGIDLLLRVSAEPLVKINATRPYAVMVRLELLDVSAPPPPTS